MATNNTTTSVDNMQFMRSSNINIKPDDLEGEIAEKPLKSAKITNDSVSINIQLNSAGGAPLQLSSTLDEPISTTISRDLKAVGYKFAHVFFPKRNNLLLKDWDLWGPLCLSVLLSVTLQGNTNAANGDNAPEFANVFALIALGAVVVTVNTKLLAGKISIFQSICVLGYCLLPLVLVSLVSSLIILIIGIKSFVMFTVHFALVAVAFAWSVFASTAFLAAETINLVDRKALAIYPIFLFYFVISWLIILHTN